MFSLTLIFTKCMKHCRNPNGMERLVFRRATVDTSPLEHPFSRSLTRCS